MDTLTREQRSERMGRIKAKNSGPEMRVRRLIHKLGFRYRLHSSDLPGKPDIVFRKRKLVIFVHGCFWHRHITPTCNLARLPKSRLEFWVPKLERNRIRDLDNQKRLEALGWKVLVIWECETANMAAVESAILDFMRPK
jgi:DNA mismatch endonuclease (patch repair protein)